MYCIPVLAPHANLVVSGVCVLIGRLPMIVYDAFLATSITDLNSLLTGRLETPVMTGVFWGSIGVTALISVVLYVKIRRAFMEAVRMALVVEEEEEMEETAVMVDEEEEENGIQEMENEEEELGGNGWDRSSNLQSTSRGIQESVDNDSISDRRL